MKKLVKRLLLAIYGVFPKSFRNRLFSGTVLFLVYHEIDAARLSKHITLLQEIGFEIIGLKELLSIRDEPSKRRSRRYAVLTFDDGWSSNFDLLPVLKEHNISIVIFLLIGLIGTQRTIWNFTLKGDGNEKQLNEALKKVGSKERNHILYQKKGYYPEKEYPSRDFLSWHEVFQMKDHVEFNSHGMFHYPLPAEDCNEVRNELIESKRQLKENIPNSGLCFAFPYGLYGKREVREAIKQGYNLVRGTGSASIFKIGSIDYFIRASDVPGHTEPKTLLRIILWSEVVSFFVYAKKVSKDFLKSK